MRQPDIKFTVEVTGPNGYREETVFAQTHADARFQANAYVLKDGESIRDIHINRR